MAYYPPLPPGQTLSASSAPVVLASDQSPIPTSLPKNVLTTGVLSGLNQSITAAFGDGNAGGIHIDGTFSGTITFSASIDGINFVPMSCIPLSGGPKIQLTKSIGDWDFTGGGQQYFKAMMTNYISGSANVTILKTSGIKFSRVFNTDPNNLYATVNLRDGSSNNLNSISGSLVVASDPNNPFTINGYDPNFQKLIVGTARDKFRDEFFTFDTTNNWDLIQLGNGMTINASGNGNGARYLYVQTSTVPNTETIIQTKKSFFAPMKVGFALSLSQRIAGQEFYIEAVSVDASGNVEVDSTYPSPNTENALNAIGYKFDGTTATTANYFTRGFGTPEISGAGVTVGTTVATGTTPNFIPATQYEINFDMEQGIFGSWGIDSLAAVTNVYKRTQCLPDPAKQYKIRVRIKNLAPATTTDFRLHYIRLLDTTRVTVDFSRHMGRPTDLASSLPVVIAGWNGTQAVTIAANSSINVSQVGGTNTVNGGLAGVLSVGGAAADSAAGNTNPILVGGKVKTAIDTTYVANDVQVATSTTDMQILTKPYGLPETDFQYTSLLSVSGAPIAVKTAVASTRNHVTALKLANSSTTPTSFYIADGATIIYQDWIPASTSLPPITFPTPLRGTQNTALNISLSGVPALTGGFLYTNIQGYTAF